MNLDALIAENNRRAIPYARIAPRAVATVIRAGRIADAVRNSAETILADARLSPGAKRDDIRSNIGKKLASRLLLVRAAHNREKDAIVDERAKAEDEAFKQYDNDSLAVAIVTALKGMKPADAMREASSSPRVLSAIRGVPSFLHGIPAEVVGQLVEHHLQTNFPDRLVKIDAMQEVVASIGAALETAEAVVREAGEFRDRRETDIWLEQFAPSKADIEAEKSGGPAPGHPSIGPLMSEELVGSEVLAGLAA